jgi:response regulator RpfG family c-di-GMP phosphodiesterase
VLCRPLTAGSAASGIDRGQQALIHVVDSLVGLLELDQRRFAASSHHVMRLARATAEELAANEEMLRETLLGALLRNIGRAAVEPEDLFDEDPTAEDYPARVQQHVTSSLRLLEHVDFPWKVMPLIRHQHERYDGTGQPDGLRGREIPMGARILAVVNAWVAMTAREHEQRTADEALAWLVVHAGRAFDPEVVEAFHRVIDRDLSAGRRDKGRPRVLIVDADEQFRRLLKMRLQNEGLDTVEASSYEKGLEAMLERPPALTLLDLDRDATEAFQLLHELQQDPRLARLPVALTCGRRDRVLKLRALRQGVDDFIVKGDDLEELVARVQNVLTREAVRNAGERAPARRGITGDLENLALPDIVQTLTIGMKTACVSLTCDEQSGQIWFENGVPRHARIDELEGELAFYEMVRWTAGEFVIEHGVRTKKKSLDHDAMFLLMEGLRLMDEAAGSAGLAAF